MSNIVKVRITNSDNIRWYKNGQEYEVYDELLQGPDRYRVANNGKNYDTYIQQRHCEFVTPVDKIVEHDGVKYKVPGWAKFITRDGGERRRVFAWENEPTWEGMDEGGQAGPGYQERSDGKRAEVRPYVAPKPKDNFIKEI